MFSDKNEYTRILSSGSLVVNIYKNCCLPQNSTVFSSRVDSIRADIVILRVYCISTRRKLLFVEV